MDVNSELTQLETAGLVRQLQEEELAYLFKHILVQETTYGSLLKNDRKRLHHAVGDALEQAFPQQLDDLAPLLGNHFQEAGEDERALVYFTRAGDRAARVFANAEAILHLTRAIEIAAQLPHIADDALIHLFLARGRALELSAQYDEAIENYDVLEKLGRERSNRKLELAALVARLPVFSTPTSKFDPKYAQALSERALALAQELGDRPAEAKVFWLRLLLGVRSLSSSQAIADGEAALALARELNLKEQLAYTLNDLGSAYAGDANFARSRELHAEALGLWKELGNLPMLADTLSNTAGFMVFTGEWDQAIEDGEEAYHISEAIGNLWGESYGLMNLGEIFAERGEITRAIETMQQCVKLAEQAGFIAPQGRTRFALAELYARLGDREKSRELADQAISTEQKFLREMHPFTLAGMARLYVSQGDLESAEESIRRSRAELEKPERASQLSGPYTLVVLLAEAELAIARGEYAHAMPLLDVLRAGLEKRGVRMFLSDVLCDKGKALLGLGQLDTARKVLEEADNMAAALTARRIRWQILARRAEVEEKLGNVAAAQAFRALARELIEFIAAHTPPDLRERFLNLPDVNGVL